MYNIGIIYKQWTMWKKLTNIQNKLKINYTFSWYLKLCKIFVSAVTWRHYPHVWWRSEKELNIYGGTCMELCKSSSTEKIQQLKTESKQTRKNTYAQRILRVGEIETNTFQGKEKITDFFLRIRNQPLWNRNYDAFWKTLLLRNHIASCTYCMPQ